MFKEVGCYVMDGYNYNHIAVDSPDGLITSNHDESDPNCCKSDLLFDELSNISVEIKSPYPDALRVPVHYKIPRCYVMQILMHMKIT